MDYRFGEKQEVVANRRGFFEKARVPVERTVFLSVAHGTKIIEATTSLAGVGFYSREAAIKADALITREKNLALIILTADCIPLILFDHANEVVGLVHISRHNTKDSFSQIVLSYMKRQFNSDMKEIKIFFGPAIKKESYILPEYPQGYDLISENINQLLLKGVVGENIFVDPTDTAKSRNFFSHYRAAREKEAEGRLATAVMLV